MRAGTRFSALLGSARCSALFVWSGFAGGDDGQPPSHPIGTTRSGEGGMSNRHLICPPGDTIGRQYSNPCLLFLTFLPELTFTQIALPPVEEKWKAQSPAEKVLARPAPTQK